MLYCRPQNKIDEKKKRPSLHKGDNSYELVEQNDRRLMLGKLRLVARVQSKLFHTTK